MYRADVFYPVEQGVGSFTRYYLGTKPIITTILKWMIAS